MLRTGSMPSVARAAALLPAVCVVLAAAAPRSGGTESAPVRAGLQVVHWVTESAGERRVDVYAFDCSRGRYAHVVSERYRGRTRVERIALAEERWAGVLQPLPPKYPALAVHRARVVACAPAGSRR